MVTIGYILCSNPEVNLGSTRISALNMFDHLRQSGYSPVVIYHPRDFYEPHKKKEVEKLERIVNTAEKCDVVYFQKVTGPSAVRLALTLKGRGVITIFGVCDLVDNEMVAACDITITNCEYLKRHFDTDLQAKVQLIHDGIESHEVHKAKYSAHFATSSNPLKAVLLTSQPLVTIPVLTQLPDYVKLAVIGKYDPSTYFKSRVSRAIKGMAEEPSPERLGEYLIKLRNHLVKKYRLIAERQGIAFEKIAWNKETVAQQLLDCDVAIIPANLDESGNFNRKNAKSANRLTQLMSIGLPLIASPVPSYLLVVKNGENGFIAKNMYEWYAALEILRDPVAREQIGRRARESVMDEYSQRRQAEMLIDLLNSLTKQKDT